MHRRRAFVIALLAASRPAVSAAAASPTDAPAVRLPVDFGAHPGASIEWWYVTGALAAGARTWGFQITFFSAATGLAGEAAGASRFAARQIVFAHAAVTDLQQRRMRHDQRVARSGFGIAAAAEGETRLVLRDWRLERSSGAAGRSRYQTSAGSDGGGFAFRLVLEAMQPPLLQGAGGLSQKGPRGEQSSHYYSEPQLAASGTLVIDGRSTAVTGTAWLDHEWSNAFLDPVAVGWDWIGMNLDDGGALTAFRVRTADGSALWAGGSFRAAGGAVRSFANEEVAFTPGRVWQSAASKARYPVEWHVATPAGRFMVRALLDDQELDSRASTGAIYWEGLSLLLDASGQGVGRGYLEMTGYAGRLVL
ncbi:MAG: lipocalin-like domain-containing protein [Caldimonas sp.]